MPAPDLEVYRAEILRRLEELKVEDARGKDALQNQAMAKAQATRRAAQRQRLMAALARIESDEFGYCSDCGADLEPARLSVDPTIPRCMSCTRG